MKPGHTARTFFPKLIDALQAGDAGRARQACAREGEAGIQLDRTTFDGMRQETVPEHTGVESQRARRRIQNKSKQQEDGHE